MADPRPGSQPPANEPPANEPPANEPPASERPTRSTAQDAPATQQVMVAPPGFQIVATGAPAPTEGLDEAPPGGRYEVNGKIVNAWGEPYKKNQDVDQLARDAENRLGQREGEADGR